MGGKNTWIIFERICLEFCSPQWEFPFHLCYFKKQFQYLCTYYPAWNRVKQTSPWMYKDRGYCNAHLLFKNSFRKLNMGLKTKSKTSTSSIIQPSQGSRSKTLFQQGKNKIALHFNYTSPPGTGSSEAGKVFKELFSSFASLSKE